MTVLDTEERAEQDKQGYLLKKLTLAFGETTQEKKKKKPDIVNALKEKGKVMCGKEIKRWSQITDQSNLA